MKRRTLLWTANFTMVVLLTMCMVSGVQASHPHPATGLPAPWTSTDIGSVGTGGSATASGDSFNVQGSGTDIWSTADSFQYAYQPLTGDGQIFARVDSQSGTNAWAKAGVMIRETLDPGSPNVLLSLTPGNGLSFQWRSAAAQISNYRAGPAVTAPYWVKLVRAGDVITGYASPDGQTWTQVNNVTLPMTASVYIGLAVVSHDNTTLDSAKFSNVGPSSNPLPPVQSPMPQNLALNGSVTASSSDPLHPPKNAVDGDPTTYWSNAPNDIHPTITVDLGANYPLYGISLTWLDTNSRTFDIQASDDGNAWTSISEVINNSQPSFKLNLQKATKGTRGTVPATATKGTHGSAPATSTKGTKGSAPATSTKNNKATVPNDDNLYPSVLARYVRLVISPNAGNVYELAEFEIDGTIILPPGQQGPSGAINLASNRPATASSSDSSSPQDAVDGDTNTGWTSSNNGGAEWLQVDLGATYAINEVVLYWGNAYANAYQIQVSDDQTNWTWVYSTINGGGAMEDLTGLSGSGRYLRIYMTGRSGENSNFSVNELQVFGSAVGPQGPEGDVGPQGPQGLPGGPINLALNRPSDSSCTASMAIVNKANQTGKPATPRKPFHAHRNANHQNVKPNSQAVDPYGSQNAFDGDLTTSWVSSTSNDDVWLGVDLGSIYSINEVKLFWGSQYAVNYDIEVSNDTNTWTTIYTATNHNGGVLDRGVEDLTGLSGSGRYIELYIPGVNNNDFSVKEFQVFGSAVGPQGAAGVIDLTSGRSATSSSDNGSQVNAQRAIDGDLTTRWESATTSSNQWLEVDLGSTFTINEARLYWKSGEYPSSYLIQDSTDGSNWTTIDTITSGGGGTVDFTGLGGTGRYIRVYINSSTNAAFSLWEFQVFGDVSSSV